ncbi:MAG: L-glutamate gamma-semialdehyde dehydrogenase [bacterium]
MKEFTNAPLLDFSRPENASLMRDALEKVRSELGREYSILIGGERIKAPSTFKSTNPSRPSEVVGVHQSGSAEIGRKAVEVAAETFLAWSRRDPSERADYLFAAADVLRRRRCEFSAWMVFEVGKTWVEADADTAEAIDFLEFYGREMLRYAAPQPLTPYPGERNDLVYIPLGVGVVIPPWNFPLAIMAGMTCAALVTGNTVVLKPASDSPTIAAKFVEVLEEVGVPRGVVNLVTGEGATIGQAIVEHPKTRFIAFTGSKEVGLGINETAAKTRPGQIWIKRVVAEMGGKDSIVVDDDTDLDAAADGVVAAAFGYQGQKCSACSRAIVVDRVYDTFVEKLEKRVRAIKVGSPEDPANFMGPVVSARAKKKILEYIETGKKEGRLIAGGESGAGDGHFIAPTVIADVAPTATIAQEEIFGPVLAVIRAKDYDDALAIANNTIYGLTGAVFTRSREKLERARQVFHVGNLYLNRKCTGALVGVHPFGGFNMSGTDSKAGGRDYLLLFLQAKSIAERLS